MSIPCNAVDVRMKCEDPIVNVVSIGISTSQDLTHDTYERVRMREFPCGREHKPSIGYLSKCGSWIVLGQMRRLDKILKDKILSSLILLLS